MSVFEWFANRPDGNTARRALSDYPLRSNDKSYSEADSCEKAHEPADDILCRYHDPDADAAYYDD